MVNVAGQKAIKSKPSNAGADIPRFASQNWLKPFISNDLEVAPQFLDNINKIINYFWP